MGTQLYFKEDKCDLVLITIRVVHVHVGSFIMKDKNKFLPI